MSLLAGGGRREAPERIRVWTALKALFTREVLPDPQGIASFGILTLVLSAHILATPDPEGRLFGGLIAFLPGALRGPWWDACFEGGGQAVLLVGPLFCLYAGARHLFREGDSLLPYVTFLGGGLLSVITLAAVVYASLL